MFMRKWLELFEHTIDFDEPPFVNEDGEINYASRAVAVIKAVEEFSRNLPIRVEMLPYRNRFTGDIQGVVLTDLYADNPGDGAGTKVMQFMIGLADQAEINIFTDAEGPRSKAFYEKFGFSKNNNGGHMLVYHPPLPSWMTED